MFTPKPPLAELPKRLFILAFDHRGSFQEKLLGIKGREPTAPEKEQISSYKNLIYRGFIQAIKEGVPQADAGLLTDDLYGSQILLDAKKQGYLTMAPVEKSGADYFEFEHGDQFIQKIESLRPNVIKVLVRHNVGNPAAKNKVQLARLKLLSDYCRETRQHFLLELLVPSTAKQLQECNGDPEEYEFYGRPEQTFLSIRDIQEAEIRPTIWKIEGMQSRKAAQSVANLICRDGRNPVKLVLLGRGEGQEKVKDWFMNTTGSPEYIGFAVGRSIFMDPLKALRAGDISEAKAVEKIAKNYRYYCDLWEAIHPRR